MRAWSVTLDSGRIITPETPPDSLTDSEIRELSKLAALLEFKEAVKKIAAQGMPHAPKP